MPTSLADAISSTGMIPPDNGSDLQPPANQNKPKPTSESSIVSEGQKGVEDSVKKLDSLNPPPPPQFKEAPKFETSDSVQQGYVSAIGVLGAIASAFTRRPMVNSMNSAAAVVGAMKAGDQEAFKQNMEKWKIDNENIKALSDYQQGIYKDILDNTKIGIDEKMGLLQAHASAFKDDAMISLSKQRNEMDAQQLLLDREKAQKTWDEKAVEIGQKTQEFNDKQNLIKEIIKAHPEYTPEQKAQAFAKVMNPSVAAADIKAQNDPKNKVTLTDSAIKTYAKAIKNGIKPSALGLGYGNNANKTAVMNAVSESDPNFDMAAAEAGYGGTQQEARTVGLNAGKITLAANSLDRQIPIAKEAAKNVDLGQFQDLNSLENYASSHTGDPNITKLNASLQAVVSDYAAIMVRGGAPTVESREAARQMVNQNMSEGQLDGFFDQVEKEKDAQIEAIKDTKKEISGQASGDFPPPPAEAITQLKSSPNTANHFDEIFGPGSAEKVLGK